MKRYFLISLVAAAIFPASVSAQNRPAPQVSISQFEHQLPKVQWMEQEAPTASSLGELLLEKPTEKNLPDLFQRFYRTAQDLQANGFSISKTADGQSIKVTYYQISQPSLPVTPSLYIMNVSAKNRNIIWNDQKITVPPLSLIRKPMAEITSDLIRTGGLLGTSLRISGLGERYNMYYQIKGQGFSTEQNNGMLNFKIGDFTPLDDTAGEFLRAVLSTK